MVVVGAGGGDKVFVPVSVVKERRIEMQWKLQAVDYELRSLFAKYTRIKGIYSGYADGSGENNKCEYI